MAIYKRFGWMALALMTSSLAWAQTPPTAATVRKVDTVQNKITLAHEALQNLDMPPMTMVFRVRTPAQLHNLQPGSRVLFRAEHEGGQYWAADIQPQAPTKP